MNLFHNKIKFCNLYKDVLHRFYLSLFVVPLIISTLLPSPLQSQENATFQLGLLKYNGGGDWYANLETSLLNLANFCNEELNMNLNPEQAIVEVGSPDIFNYPFIHMTGHGNVVFSDEEITNLRTYLISGGFLHIDDNYGIDKFVRSQMKLVFPELDFIELPFNHPIYHQTFDFKNGLPKIHVHNGKPPQGFGLIYEGRLVCFYTYECDLGDGWEDHEVHNDSKEKHLEALKMGANIIQYVFMGESTNRNEQ